MINLDARGTPFLMDGTQVNRLTLKALKNKLALVPSGADLFGDGVAAYEISSEVSA